MQIHGIDERTPSELRKIRANSINQVDTILGHAFAGQRREAGGQLASTMVRHHGELIAAINDHLGDDGPSVDFYEEAADMVGLAISGVEQPGDVLLEFALG
ncbi:hypothetical protein [Conexibacter sp. SYSU D00693]|uniref:hypothetical protein n=1 Tax=Conexibacter sp. SYSU D00693 TaxID=2812560 RepID=UPI00196AAAC7|nr:hypothetical protein [Conexibacter sp. SYSU D00693]